MDLTKREQQIVEHLANGMTCEEIAAGFCRSVHTVRTQIQNACKRNKAKNTPHLVALSISRGYIRMLCGLLAIAMLMGADDGYRNRAQPRLARKAEVAANYA